MDSWAGSEAWLGLPWPCLTTYTLKPWFALPVSAPTGGAGKALGRFRPSPPLYCWLHVSQEARAWRVFQKCAVTLPSSTPTCLLALSWRGWLALPPPALPFPPPLPIAMGLVRVLARVLAPLGVLVVVHLHLHLHPRGWWWAAPLWPRRLVSAPPRHPPNPPFSTTGHLVRCSCKPRLPAGWVWACRRGMHFLGLGC